MLRYTLLIAASIALNFAANAQGWFTPVNFGLLPSSANHSIRYDDIYFLSRDTGVLVSSYGIIFKTYDGARSWQIKNTAAPHYFRSLEFSADGQVGIAGTLSGTVYRSADRGETWQDISSAIADTSVNPRRICGLAHFGNTFWGVGWWGGKTAHVYKSTDAGQTWQTTYLDTNLASGLVDAVFLNADTGFITGCKSIPMPFSSWAKESVVLRTTNGGTTWTKVFSDTTIGGRIWKIQFVDNEFGVGSIEPQYRDTVAMIRTTDGGLTWHIHSAGKIHAWPTFWGNQGIGFLNRQKGWMGGYYNGMFETSDGGNTWDTIATGQECDRFFLIDDIMYVSADRVYKYADSTAGPAAVPQAPVYVHQLHPVVPNPAAGKVRISFDIRQHKTNTVLEVVNTDGRRSYPIMSGYLDPGHYEYTWDATSAPPGNYIIWLGTDEIPMVQKFIVK